MRRNLIHFLLVMIFTVCSTTVLAQVTVKGQVVDGETNEPLIGAAITVSGTTTGVVTDIDGNFTINATPNVTLVISYLGYKEQTVKVPQNRNLGVVKLQADAVLLNDVVITSSVAVSRKTPVAVSTINPVFIEERLGMADFPELLKMTPSITIVKQGGAFGDSEVRMRGFKQENIAVMVNGVPMNDMEWGGIYWSNWAGLSDVTRSKQVQRGLGASKLSAPSVGGSVNIVTNTIEAKKGGSVSYGMGQDGYNKVLFNVSTGLTKDGWAMTLLGGKEWGDGYIQGTEYESYNYFFNLSKRINDNHQLSLTAFGAPQWHNQRSRYDGLTIKGWQEVGKYMEPGEQYLYNATYGFGKNGERKTSARNKYHKPQISLNHIWQIDMKSTLSTALYTSIGDGWGYSGQNTSAYNSAWYGSSNGVLSTRFRNPDGTFAYDQIQEMNEQSESGSQMVMSVSKNLHNWYGILSTYSLDLNERINIQAGVDGRYYKGIHTNEIVDLYNGAYYVDRYRASVSAANYAGAGTDAFKNKKLTVGDVVYRDYDGYVVQGGAFGQVEYSTDLLSAFVGGSVNAVSQWRYDRFYYDKEHAESDKVNKIGFNVKGGLNYNFSENHNAFANVGYISRAPFFSGGAFLQSTTSNITNPNAVNEKIFSFELGYGYTSKYLAANLNLYHTQWMDKTMTRMTDITDKDRNPDRASINMQGVDATHQGVELELTAKPLKWLDVRGMFSMGNWRWNGQAIGYWYNSGGQPLATDYGVASGIGAEDHAKSVIDLTKIKVGGSAQTTASLGVVVKPLKDIRFGVDWSFSGRYYSDYSFSGSNLSIGGNYAISEPWRIPSYSVFDFFGSYSFEIAGLRSVLSGNISNIFDQEYIQSATNGDGTWEGAYGVEYGFGRRMNVKLKINF